MEGMQKSIIIRDKYKLNANSICFRKGMYWATRGPGGIIYSEYENQHVFVSGSKVLGTTVNETIESISQCVVRFEVPFSGMNVLENNVARIKPW